MQCILKFGTERVLDTSGLVTIVPKGIELYVYIMTVCAVRIIDYCILYRYVFIYAYDMLHL
jgi:hypothetical protein